MLDEGCLLCDWWAWETRSILVWLAFVWGFQLWWLSLQDIRRNDNQGGERDVFEICESVSGDDLGQDCRAPSCVDSFGFVLYDTLREVRRYLSRDEVPGGKKLQRE